MPVNDNCCCFFSSKTGVILIGVLSAWSFFVFLMQTCAYRGHWWFFFPQTVIYFVVTMHFVRLWKVYGTESDVATSYRLYYNYLINVVFLSNAWMIVVRLVLD